MYIHMHADLVRDTFRQVTCAAALNLSERARASEQEKQLKVTKIWPDEFVREAGARS